MECNMKTRLVSHPSDTAKGRQNFFQNLVPAMRHLPTTSRATFLNCFPKPLIRFRSRLKGLRLLEKVQLSFTLLVCLMCISTSVAAAGASNSSRIAVNGTYKSLNENLAFFARNSISSESASSSSEIYDPFLLFTHAVNATSLETIPTAQTNASTAAASTESKCADSADCPVALPLSAAGSSTEATYVPHVLPQWSKVMERQNHHSFESSEANNIDEGSAQEQSTTPAINWRIFKYVSHPDEISNLTTLNGTSVDDLGVPSSLEMYKIHQSNMSFSEEEAFFNKSLSSTERSLIRNSFFGNDTTNSTLEDTSGSLNETERPRRSPFRPHWKNDKLLTHREPLYGLASVPAPNLHPPPPGLALMQPLMSPPKPFQRGSFQPNRMQGDNPAHSPSIRLPSFHHPFSKPKPLKMRHQHHGRQNHHKRRPPHHGKPPRGRGRPNGSGPVPAVMPAPRPIPVPRPIPIPVPMPRPAGPITASSGGPQPMPMHHHPPHAAPLRSLGGPPPPGGPHFGGPPGGDLPPPIQYTYPKHAENIQDILSYFNSDNEIGPGPGRPSNDAFSNELKEIHGSLLKDIREFAQRPSLLGAGEKRPGRINDNPQPIKANSMPIPKPSMTSLIEEEDEDYLEPKPKPVRQLVREEDRERKNKNRERERERDRSPAEDYQDKSPDYDETRYTTSKKPQRTRRPSTSSSTYDEEDRDSYRPLEEEEEEPLNDDEDLPIRRPSATRHRDHERERQRHKDREAEDYHDHVRRPSNNKKVLKSEREQIRYYSPPTKYPVEEYESEEEKRIRFRPSQNYNKFVKDSRDRHRDRMREHYSSATKHNRPSKSSKSKGKRQNYRIRHEASANQDRFRENGNQHLRHKTLDTTPNPSKTPTAMDVAYYQQRNRPVVIKRPYQQYQPVDIRQVERQRQKQDEYWNTVSTIDVKNQQRPHHKLRSSSSTNSKPKQSVQNHYHYYGVPQGGQQPPPTRFNSGPHLGPSNSSPEEEDFLEIHTATPRGEAVANSSPGYSTISSANQLDYDRDRKARLQKMYMDYLQRKLESQAEVQAEAMLSSSSRPFIPSLPVVSPPYPQPPRPSRKPMRMKIHIYPNEQVQVVDGNNQNVYKSALAPPSSYIPNSVPRPQHYTPVPTTAYTNNQYYNPRPTPGYQKTVVHHHHSGVPGMPPYTTYNTAQHRSSSVGAPPVATSVLHPIIPAQPGRPVAGTNDKGNVVLHLHVHRRNGEAPASAGGMMMAGSENVISTVKPLTYEEIYATSGPEDQANIQDMLPSPSSPHESRRKSSSFGETGRKLAEAVDTDKSISMELPIHQDKVDHVLSTLFKMRD